MTTEQKIYEGRIIGWYAGVGVTCGDFQAAVKLPVAPQFITPKHVEDAVRVLDHMFDNHAAQKSA